MGIDIEGRVARLERALAQGLNIDLNEHNDQDQAAAKAKQDEADAADQQKQLDAASTAATADVAATPAAQALADEHGVDLTTVEGTGAEGQIIKPDVAAAVEGGGN